MAAYMAEDLAMALWACILDGDYALANQSVRHDCWCMRAEFWAYMHVDHGHPYRNADPYRTCIQLHTTLTRSHTCMHAA
jgi:hypothetical protein